RTIPPPFGCASAIPPAPKGRRCLLWPGYHFGRVVLAGPAGQGLCRGGGQNLPTGTHTPCAGKGVGTHPRSDQTLLGPGQAGSALKPPSLLFMRWRSSSDGFGGADGHRRVGVIGQETPEDHRTETGGSGGGVIPAEVRRSPSRWSNSPR